MSEWHVGDPVDAHCGHAIPYSPSQAHGVCIFCWRDRAGLLNAELKRRQNLVEPINAIEVLSSQPPMACGLAISHGWSCTAINRDEAIQRIKGNA
jgi:hypothetical protein